MQDHIELEQFRAKCAKEGMTTVVDYQTNELSVIDPTTHEVQVYPLTLTSATYFVL